jgi:hypothetical protein
MRWTLRRQVRSVIGGKVETGFPIRITLNKAHRTKTPIAYGEVVWSWRRDPGATLARNFPAGNGGKKGRFPGESTYKP